MISPFWSINFFSIPETFRTTEWFVCKTFGFGPLRQKISTKPWCPSSHGWKISIKDFFWNTKVFSNEMFRYSRTKTSRPTLIPPLLSIKYFSLPAVFGSTESFSGEFFSVLWEKQNFDRTVKPPLSFAWNFSIPEFFRNTETYRHWDTKKIRQKILILPPSPLLPINFFVTRKFLEQRRVPQEVFRYCETTTFV